MKNILTRAFVYRAASPDSPRAEAPPLPPPFFIFI